VELADEAATPLTTFISTAVGVSAAVVAITTAVGFTVGVLTGLACSKKRHRPTSPCSDMGSAIGTGVTPVYEEVGLHEVKEIHFADNTAYGYKS
jgi:ABC-type dipeptide/oligopeptide/nickel transport system permease component